VSLDRLEVVLSHVVSDLLAEHGSLHVGGSEVDACPDAGVDHLLERIREPVEASRRARLVAVRAESDLVGAEEVLERVHECTGRAAVPRGMIREGRRDERWWRHSYRWVKQRQPRRVGLGGRVTVGVGLANRRDRTPELPVILIVPAAD